MSRVLNESRIEPFSWALTRRQMSGSVAPGAMFWLIISAWYVMHTPGLKPTSTPVLLFAGAGAMLFGVVVAPVLTLLKCLAFGAVNRFFVSGGTLGSAFNWLLALPFILLAYLGLPLIALVLISSLFPVFLAIGAKG